MVSKRTLPAAPVLGAGELAAPLDPEEAGREDVPAAEEVGRGVVTALDAPVETGVVTDAGAEEAPLAPELAAPHCDCCMAKAWAVSSGQVVAMHAATAAWNAVSVQTHAVLVVGSQVGVADCVKQFERQADKLGVPAGAVPASVVALPLTSAELDADVS